MSDFGGQLQSFADRVGIKFDKVVRKVVIDMTRELVMATPVDTGMARSAWFWGMSRVTTVPSMDVSKVVKQKRFETIGGKKVYYRDSNASRNGGESIARSLEFASGLKAGGVFYITNNLPYIMRLEYGSSSQAPGGMARKTVDRWQGIVNKAVQAIR